MMPLFNFYPWVLQWIIRETFDVVLILDEKFGVFETLKVIPPKLFQQNKFKNMFLISFWCFSCFNIIYFSSCVCKLKSDLSKQGDLVAPDVTTFVGACAWRPFQLRRRSIEFPQRWASSISCTTWGAPVPCRCSWYVVGFFIGRWCYFLDVYLKGPVVWCKMGGRRTTF